MTRAENINLGASSAKQLDGVGRALASSYMQRSQPGAIPLVDICATSNQPSNGCAVIVARRAVQLGPDHGDEVASTPCRAKRARPWQNHAAAGFGAAMGRAGEKLRARPGPCAKSCLSPFEFQAGEERS